MIGNTIAGLEGQLESAYYGTGPDGDSWFVPAPSAELDKLQLQWALDKLFEFIGDISQVVAAAGPMDPTTRVNGEKMIALFNQRVNQYNAALDKLEQTPDSEIEPRPGEDSEPQPGNKMTVWFIGGALLLILFAYGADKNKR